MDPLSVLVALAPVVIFLTALVLLDSYKLVPKRSVAYSIAFGAGAALACAWINGALLELSGLSFASYSRYVAPVAEEGAKAIWITWLIRSHRIGFLVDVAILGFAVGTGFALVENVVFLQIGTGGLFLSIARGFGTAILHGSTMVIFGVVSKTLLDRRGSDSILLLLPGLAAAVALHSLYNHFVLPPLVAASVLLIVLPTLVVVVFERSEKATRSWLGVGFDADLEILERIESGEIGEGPIGRYLESLKTRFAGSIVADMFCLLQIHHELGIRAKGMLLARESGFEIPLDDTVRANLAELAYLEKSIGRTGRLALRPILDTGGRDRWQLHLLER